LSRLINNQNLFKILKNKIPGSEEIQDWGILIPCWHVKRPKRKVRFERAKPELG